MDLSKRGYAAVTFLLASGLSAVVLWDVYADWALEGKSLLSTIAENAFPLALALGVLFGGYWLYRNRDHRYVATVTRWQVIGTLGIFALVGWVVGIQITQGELKPRVIVIQTTIGGLTAGSLIGYANARTEETLARVRRERDRFEALFENTPAGTVEVHLEDGEPIVRRANAAFEAWFEVAESESPPLFEVVDHDEDTRESIRAHVAERESLETSASAETAGGRKFFELRVSPYGDSGEAYLIYTDVTELTETKRELEQTVARLERSNERLEEFAYVASHDLQEPLRTVSRYVEIVEDELEGRLDESTREYIDTVVTGTERMQSMVSGLLEYSRVTTRGEPFEPVDVEEVVEGVVEDLDLLRAEQDGTIEVGSLPTVEADRDQLWQVFQNLVKNALEHSEGPVDISISAEEGDDAYRFVVADDGPGIDPHIEDDLFQMFESGESYHTSGDARGIGLAVVERIVDRHDGDIWVESEPGEGSRFVFTIPRSNG